MSLRPSDCLMGRDPLTPDKDGSLPFFDFSFALKFRQPSKCEPQFAKEADINLIAERFLKTGVLPQSALNSSAPVYGDSTVLPQGTDALMARRISMQVFESLPAEVRAAYGHDLTQLGKALGSKEGVAEFVSLFKLPTPPPASPAEGVLPASPAAAVSAASPGASAPGAAPAASSSSSTSVSK